MIIVHNRYHWYSINYIIILNLLQHYHCQIAVPRCEAVNYNNPRFLVSYIISQSELLLSTHHTSLLLLTIILGSTSLLHQTSDTLSGTITVQRTGFDIRNITNINTIWRSIQTLYLESQDKVVWKKETHRSDPSLILVSLPIHL